MPVGRIFGDLSIFDLLGNFVPGVLLMGSLILLFPADRVSQISSSPVVWIFLFGVIAFALGHLVQSYAAEAVGNRETFRNSILMHQSLGQSKLLDFETYQTAHPTLYSLYATLHPAEPEAWDPATYFSGGEDGETDLVQGEGVLDSERVTQRLYRVPARWYRAFVEAVFMVRIKRDRPLSDITLAGKTWAMCRKKYELDSQYKQYGDLLHLISSDIETHANSSRALRFQAIRNFHRGMWISCYFSFLLVLSVALIRPFSPHVVAIADTLGLTVWRPLLVDLWTPVWMVCLGFAVLLYLFWELKEDFEEEFIEYLLTDYLAVHSSLNDLREQDEPEWASRDVPDWFR